METEQVLIARVLLHVSEEEIWQLDKRNNPVVKLKTDNGVVEVDIRSVIISWYAWALHRHYPELALNDEHVVRTGFIKDGHFHIPLDLAMQELNKKPRSPYEIVAMREIEQDSINDLYNAIVMRLGEYVITSNVYDNIDLIDDPVIQEIRRNLKPNSESIVDGYKRGLERILQPDALMHNRVAWLVKASIVSPGQLLQGVIARGFVNDITRRIFPNPILSSYIEGMGKIADSAMESRSATKAATANGKPLEDSEWFHRKIQIAAAVIMRSHYNEDCGSKRTVPFKVSSSSLKTNLLGKYYVGEDKVLRNITQEHLSEIKVGQVLQLRSPMFCNHKDRSGVCETCFGTLTKSIPFNVMSGYQGNVGHACAVEIISRISQMMLSTKHEDTSTTASPFIVRHVDMPYIQSDKSGIIRLNPNLKGKGLRLMFPGTVKGFLSGLMDVDDLNLLDNSNMIGLEYIDVCIPEVDESTGEISYTFNNVLVSVESRRAIFSKEFIEYVRDVKWETEYGDRISVSLEKFNFEDGFLELPFMYEDMMVYQANVEKFVKFSNRNERWLNTEVNEEFAGRVLEEWFGLLVGKMKDLNIIHAEIILYACMCRDPFHLDYSLPKGDDTRYFRSFEKCIEWRSIPGLLAYQGQAEVFKNPATYLVENRQPHPMDAILR